MADGNWKERLGFEINFCSDDDDDDSRKKQEDLSPLSPGVEALLMDYDHLGTTPPRTRIRNKDKSRKNKDASTKSSPRIIYGGRNSSEKNVFNRASSETCGDEGDNNVDNRRPNNYNKRTLQRQRGSERDLKLDLSDVRPREERAESLPSQNAFKIYGFQVESCNRFMSLSSKPVASRTNRTLQLPSTQSIDECSQSRVDFYQTFSMLIKMGNPERQCDMANCKRQLSREEHLWQNELKDLIWLELQAWHADRTPQQQDQYLCEARETVQPLLLEIINYKFKRQSDPNSSNDSGIYIPGPDAEKVGHSASCVSMLCGQCMEEQNRALREVGALMTRLQAAEALFPSSKAFAAQYPLYMSNTFIARVKAMCVWYNMTKHHRLKLLILGRHLLTHAEQSQSEALDVINELTDMLNRSAKCSPAQSSGDDSTNDFFNTQTLLKAAQYLEKPEIAPNTSLFSCEPFLTVGYFCVLVGTLCNCLEQ